jgi:SAM-dependent methyltransferase
MNLKKFTRYETRALSTVYSESEGGFHDDIIPDIVNKFLPYFNLSKDASVLDIGCGPGVFIRHMRTLGYNNVTGVTLSSEDVSACKRQEFNVLSSSMSDLPINDGSIDFIWCRHALEHSPYPLFTLYEFERVLSKSGQIFIEVPAPDNERTYMHEFNPNHYSILGERMWQGLFDKTKLTPTNFWKYNIDLPLDNKIVTEHSYMFALKKSD